MSYKVIEIQQDAVKIADNIDKINITGTRLVPAISPDGKTLTLSVTAAVTSSYNIISDGTNTATAAGGDTLTFRTGNNILDVLVTNDEPIYGDNVLLTVNQGNISHTAISNVGSNTHAQIDTHINKFNNYAIDVLSSGIVFGGVLSPPVSGISVQITGGEGYINTGTDHLEIIWNTTSVDTIGDGINYIGIDISGTPVVSLSPLASNIISLGTAVAVATNTMVAEVFSTPVILSDFSRRIHDYLADIGVFVTGSAVSEKSSPNLLELNIDAGSARVGLTTATWSATSNFSKIFFTTDIGFNADITDVNKVNVTQWNDITQPNATALVTMTPGYWKKDMVIRAQNGTVYYIYGQAEYQTYEQALIAPIPTAPIGSLEHDGYLAYILVQKDATTVGSYINDIRPSFPRIFGYGTEHAGLSNGYSDIDHEHDIGGFTNSSTGLLVGGELNINVDPTKFDLSAGTGVIIDNTTDSLKPSHKVISWPAATGVTVTNLATQAVTYVAIDDTGAIVQSATPFDNSLSRQYIAIGRLGHGNFTDIVGFRGMPNAAFDPAGRLGDLITALGTFNISGNEYQAFSTDLTIVKSAGSTFSLGVNFSTDKKSPDVSQDTYAAPVTFKYSYRDGSTGFTLGTDTTFVDPNYYDNGTGTLTAVPAGEWTVQVVTFIPGVSPSHRIEYGQMTFATQDIALQAGIPDPDFVYNPNFGLGIIRTFIVVQQGTTDLSNVSTALFVQSGKFGVGSGGSSGGGGVVIGAPSDASYIVLSADPTLTNEKVIGTDFFVTNSHVGTNAGIVESKLALNYATHSNVNDPSVGEKLALAGTSGTPGTANRYVTDTDARNTNARTPTPHVIITDTAIGPEHTISGGITGYVFKATGATTAQLAQLDHAELSSVGTNTHTQIDSFIASKGTTNGLASLDSSTKVPNAQISNVLSITDLTSYTTTSGTGNTAILSTITTPTAGQILTWSGTNWINQTPPSALADSGSNGIVVRTALNTTAARTLTAPSAGISITNADGVAGNPTFALTNDLAAIEGLTSTGFGVRTTTDTWAQRIIVGTTNTISVNNGDGILGNPTITIAPNPIIPGTEAMVLPAGATSGRPLSATVGAIRFNTTTLTAEVYNGSSWLATTNQGTVTSVNASGGTTGLSFSGGPIVSAGTLTLSGTLTTSNGGTGLSSIGTANQLLGVNAGATGLEYKLVAAGTGINITNGTGTVTISAINNGTVTSVGLSAPSMFTVSNSPVTTSGTLTLTLATQAAHAVLAGPVSGADATPIFRTLSLLNGDMSDVSITTPTNAQVLTYNSGTSKWINSSQAATSYSAVISSWTLATGNQYYADVTHNLGTFNVVISLFNATTNALIQANSIVLTNANVARITVTGTPAYNIRCNVIANGTTIAAGGSTPSSIIVQQNGVPLTGTYTTINVDSGLSVINSGSGVATISSATSIPLRTLSYFATSLDSPNNADWVVNALAPTISDPTRPAMNVRQFSNTIEQGVGMYVPIPAGSTSIAISYRGRTVTAPAAAANLQLKLYTRNIPNNAAISSWTAGTNLTSVTVPTNAYVQYYTQTITLASLGLTAGNLYQFELTRNVAVAGNLAYNWLMNELTFSFT